MFCLILLGHPILISSTVLFVRKRAFETKFRGIAEEHARRHLPFQQCIHLPRIGKKKHDAENFNTPGSKENAPGPHQKNVGAQDHRAVLRPSVANKAVTSENICQYSDSIGWIDDDQITIRTAARERSSRHRVFPMAGIGAHPDAKDPKDAIPSLFIDDDRRSSIIKNAIRDTQKYFLSRGFISRNSQFHGLTVSDREKLGGVEYKAISFLSVVVPLYFLLFNILGALGIGAWVTAYRPSVARVDGLHPFWTGAFFAVSAFGNNGMSLLDVNMTALQTRYEVIIEIKQTLC